jgi:hypothetical protein
MDVTPRDLLCRPLAALKDNRAEAQQREHEFQNGVVESAIPTAQYRPGVFSVLDWLAYRLHKAGAAAWAWVFTEEIELDCFSAIAMCLA